MSLRLKACWKFCIAKRQTQKQLEAKDVLPNKTARTQPKGPKNAVLSLVTLTFDLEIHIPPSEGPNAPSL